jgi:hypothetical protein
MGPESFEIHDSSYIGSQWEASLLSPNDLVPRSVHPISTWRHSQSTTASGADIVHLLTPDAADGTALYGNSLPHHYGALGSHYTIEPEQAFLVPGFDDDILGLSGFEQKPDAHDLSWIAELATSYPPAADSTSYAVSDMQTECNSFLDVDHIGRVSPDDVHIPSSESSSSSDSSMQSPEVELENIVFTLPEKHTLRPHRSDSTSSSHRPSRSHRGSFSGSEPQQDTKRVRKRLLTASGRKDAAHMRKFGSCSNCKVRKQKVSFVLDPYLQLISESQPLHIGRNRRAFRLILTVLASLSRCLAMFSPVDTHNKRLAGKEACWTGSQWNSRTSRLTLESVRRFHSLQSLYQILQTQPM